MAVGVELCLTAGQKAGVSRQAIGYSLYHGTRWRWDLIGVTRGIWNRTFGISMRSHGCLDICKGLL